MACSGSAEVRQEQASQLEEAIEATINALFAGQSYQFTRGPYGGDLTDRVCLTMILTFRGPSARQERQEAIDQIADYWEQQLDLQVDTTTEELSATAVIDEVGVINASSFARGVIDIQATTSECAKEDVDSVFEDERTVPG